MLVQVVLFHQYILLEYSLHGELIQGMKNLCLESILCWFDAKTFIKGVGCFNMITDPSLLFPECASMCKIPWILAFSDLI